MSTRMLLVPAVAVALVLGAALAGDAPKAKPKNMVDKPIGKDKKVQAVEAAALARALVAYGEKKKSPAILVAAAEILIDVPVGQLEAKKSTQGPTTRPAGTEVKPVSRRPVLDFVRLLGEALLMAANDKTVQAFVKQVQERAPDATRGPVGGPLAADSILDPGFWDLFPVEFKGQEVAVVTVAADEDADLALLVFDEWGNLIGQDDLGGPVVWIPDHQATFVIKVLNRGKAPEDYTLICQ